MLAFLGSFLNPCPKLAHAHRQALEGEAETRRSRLGLAGQLSVVGLRQIDETTVVLEVGFLKLGMAVDPEAFDHQRLELSCEKVGQVEGAGLGIGERGKAILAGKGRVAMWPREALDLLLLEHAIQSTA